MKFLRLPSLFFGAVLVLAAAENPAAGKSADADPGGAGFAPAADSTAVHPPAPTEPWPHEHSDVPPDPRIKWGRLDNGVRFAVRENHEPAGRVYLVLRVHAGSLHERDDQLGYAHFVEHMMFNGTRLFPGKSLISELQHEGLQFGADTNAFTTYDSTFYDLDLPRNSPEKIGRGLQVLREFADGATFDKGSLKKEMGVIESERRTRETTATPLIEQLNHFLFPNSLLARREPIGTTKSVEGATAPRLLEFYRNWYRPSRMTVIAVGDADPALLERLIRENFSSLQPAVAVEPSDRNPGPFAAADGTDSCFIGSPYPTGTTSMVYCISPPGQGGDSVAQRRQKTAQAAGFWILSERMQDVVHADAAALGRAGATFEDYRDVHLALVQIDSRAAVWRRGLRDAEQELRRALVHGFTPSEVSEQIGRFRNFYQEAIRTEATLNSGNIAQYIRGCLDNDTVCSSAETNWKIVADSVSNLQADECTRQFQSAWSPANRRLVVVGPRSVPVNDKAILSDFKESQAGLVAAREDVAPAKFSYTSFGPPGVVHERHHVDAIDTETVEYANHVRLNLKRTDYEAGRIYLRARLGSGLAGQPPNLPGLGLMASAVFIDGGLLRHDANDLTRIMAGTTVSISFEVEEDACYFSGVSSRDGLETLLQLFTAYLTDAAYRTSAYQHAVGQLQSYYSEAARDPVTFLHSVSPRVLAGGDSRYGVPPIDQAFARNPQQMRQWLDPQMTYGELEIGIVGDLDIEQTLAYAVRTVGTLAERRPNAAPKPAERPSFPDKPLKKIFRVETSEAKSVVQVSWPGTDDNDFHRDRRLSVLGEILNDRLRVRLREELGLTYSPAADSWGSKVWPGYGYLFVEVIVAPKQAEKTASLIEQIADDIVAHGVQPDEFDRTRQPRLATLTQDLRNNSYWLYHILTTLQTSPGVAEMPLSRRSDYENMRIEDLNAVARDSLGSKRTCVLIVRPK